MDAPSLPINQFPILARLDESAQREIVAHLHRRSVAAGQMIVLAGEASEAVYLVARGRVHSQRSSIAGREFVLHDIGAGECFNLVSVLDGGVNLATVTAVLDTVLFVIPADAFRRIARDHPEISLSVLEHMARRVRHLCDAVEGLALHDVRTRLARCLLSYTHSTPGSARIRSNGRSCPRYLTQGELAAHVGTVRDVVGRTLRSFSRQGLIRNEHGRVVVTDIAGLQREALSTPEPQHA
jgi:CRP-like cAMP-binding protein